jgi:hypothetical protein
MARQSAFAPCSVMSPARNATSQLSFGGDHGAMEWEYLLLTAPTVWR